MRRYLEAGDFKSAEVKKIGDHLYRAKLDASNRLLFSIYRYHNEPCILILECIHRHAYDKSRFLQHGASIDETKIPIIARPEEAEDELAYLNPAARTFHLLDKIICFDDSQAQVYAMQPPLIIIGSAGSGKTALTLEKMKQAPGDILYVTLSPYLVKNSRDVYYAHAYENEAQQVDFLSFQEYLESIRIPAGREINFHIFQQWFQRHRHRGLDDAYKVFEEFKGVLTGADSDASWLDRDAYISLGVKQSIFSRQEREWVYDLFEQYLELLRQQNLFDINIISHEYQSLVTSTYDFIVVDEVQDLTNVQLSLILQSLRHDGEFMICGDSNQIVHPNFFSWAKVKSFFYHQRDQHARQGRPHDLIRILSTNYRNSPQVTVIANRLLEIKNARFGSIDRESNYLVNSNGHNQGSAHLLKDAEPIRLDMEKKTRQSTRFAVIVMKEEQKAAARKVFSTPLLFSVREAKGLEYENIILFNFVSAEASRFREITRGVSPGDLTGDLSYARPRDKMDKSLEAYKFHINSLYVAITRAVNNLYMIESESGHRLLHLMGMGQAGDTLNMVEQDSNLDEWRQEAHKLELQGKQEQADEIRSRILKQQEVPWVVLKDEALEALRRQAIDEDCKKAKLPLFEYALVHHNQVLLNQLIQAGFAPARNPDKGLDILNRKYFIPYESRNPVQVLRLADQYGVDFRNQFNHTPLMTAARCGNAALIERLIELGADTDQMNSNGMNSFQIALERSCALPKFAHRKLADIYHLLSPADMSVEVDGHLIKINNHLMEFTMLNLMIAMFYRHVASHLWPRLGTFECGDFIKVLDAFPATAISERRKRRSYISSILAKNEVRRDGPYNRKLFYRVHRGQYIINPKLAVRTGGTWRNIYDLLRLDMLAGKWRAHGNAYADLVNKAAAPDLERFLSYIRDIQTTPDPEITS